MKKHGTQSNHRFAVQNIPGAFLVERPKDTSDPFPALHEAEGPRPGIEAVLHVDAFQLEGFRDQVGRQTMVGVMFGQVGRPLAIGQ